jgi:branched-chain amino acid transport system permease protein
MDTFLQVTLSGVTMGCIYAFVALGFTLTIAAAGVVNFAYSEWVTYGGFIGVTMVSGLGLPLWPALALTVLICTAMGYVFQLVVFTPLEGKHFLTTVTATIGIAVSMQALATLIWGPYALTLPTFFGSGVVDVGGIAVFPHNMLIIATAVVLIGGMQFVLSGTDVGLRLQATAQDPIAARLMGIPIRRMRTIAYCLSAALAGLAGFLVAPLFVVTTTMGFGLMLKGLAATIVGGWGSLKGAVLGGLIIGIAEALSAAYLSSEYKDVISFLIIIAVLLWRPRGLFPERIAEKL